MALEGIGRLLGSFYTGYNQPYIEQKSRAELDRARALQNLQNEQANDALQKVIALEQQRQKSQNPQTTSSIQEFGRPEELALFQAYSRAGINPQELAKTETARLAADAFAQAIPNVTSDVGRINIGLGKEYKPGVYRQNEASADEAEFRLRNLQENFAQITDPLLALDAIQNKSVFDAQEVAIEGKDGKTKHGYATLTPSGSYRAAGLTDREGMPLKIPAETSKPTADMQNTKYYADLWGMTEAEASQILKSRTTDTPGEAWAKIVNAKSQNRFGNNVKPVDMLKNSMLVWGTSRQGQPLPVDIEKTISTYDVNDRQREELLSMAKQINDNARQTELQSVLANPQPPIPFPQIPGFSANTQQQPFPQMPPAAGTQPLPQAAPPPLSEPEPLPERQPLTPLAIHTAWTEIQQGTKPEEVQEALLGQGFDLSPESINMTAIDAVNSGVPANVLQQYLKSIGIEWQP